MKVLSPRVVALCLIGLVWAVILAAVGAVAAEFWLRLRAQHKPAGAKSAYERLCERYDAFSVQHLHPNYLFFFPFRWEDQKALGNEVCSLVPGGFRGWGPEDRGDRKLAFVIGGSAAFGSKSSSDQTTLAGCLNQLQKEYLFVNAGVPSWLTSQSLARLVHQIMPLNPSLIISFEMANDAQIMRRNSERSLSFPPGTPENFDKLSALVDDIRSGRRAAKETLSQRFFPNLKALLEKKVFRVSRQKRKRGETVSTPDELIQEHAAKFVTNIGIMHDLCRARGARFLSVIQPISHLHKTAPVDATDARDAATREFFQRFRESVLKQAPERLPILDLGSCFDRHFDRLPIRQEKHELNPDLVLADRVHLTDRGNQMVAQEIWAALQKVDRPAPPTPATAP